MSDQLQTIITAMLAGATSSAVVLFAAKKLFESLIDSRIRRADSAYAADFAEHMRRRAALFDAQADAIDELTALVYRIRNASRELTSRDLGTTVSDVEMTLRSLSDQFALGLTARRAVLPSLLFGTIHGIRTPLRDLLLDLDRLQKAEPTDRETILVSARNEVDRINLYYDLVVDMVQRHRGVDADLE
jgi:hypothetical protein